ncbi:hypothetical protein [Desulfosediminicola sp.]|uniref:hypothetical protein n=1 Tax=Desulfosediminicola sp. TaxID=2886825 RepID=UPI003AF23E30
MIYDTVCRQCSSCCAIEAKVINNRVVSAWRKFDEVSWDSALNCVAEKLHRSKKMSGDRSIAWLRALTGNIYLAGGDLLPQPVPVRNIQIKDRLRAGTWPVTEQYALFNTFFETR